LIECELSLLRRFWPCHVFVAPFASFWGSFYSRAGLQLEILALRHQLAVLQRSVKRPQLNAADRWLWAWLSHVWTDWRSALVMVKPETVIAWHRRGLRL
jgi:putative transposase